MKKLMIALAFVGLASTTTAMAQETEVPTKKYSVATNSFWANWFVSAGVSGTAYYTSQENGVSKNPFSDKRGTIGFTVAVGKWFTPGLGLRTKFDLIKAKQVNSETSHPLYTAMNVHEDVMFNLSNMFCGYNEKREAKLAEYKDKKPTPAEIEKINEYLQGEFNKIMENAIIKEYVKASRVFEMTLTQMDNIIKQGVSVDQGGCSGSCHSCSGCHH